MLKRILKPLWYTFLLTCGIALWVGFLFAVNLAFDVSIFAFLVFVAIIIFGFFTVAEFDKELAKAFGWLLNPPFLD